MESITSDSSSHKSHGWHQLKLIDGRNVHSWCCWMLMSMARERQVPRWYGDGMASLTCGYIPSPHHFIMWTELKWRQADETAPGWFFKSKGYHHLVKLATGVGGQPINRLPRPKLAQARFRSLAGRKPQEAACHRLVHLSAKFKFVQHVQVAEWPTVKV